jgi:hypothetical protein
MWVPAPCLIPSVLDIFQRPFIGVNTVKLIHLTAISSYGDVFFRVRVPLGLSEPLCQIQPQNRNGGKVISAPPDSADHSKTRRKRYLIYLLSAKQIVLNAGNLAANKPDTWLV